MSFFQFEANFVDSLRCIPMLVRYKLDTCGVKLKLHHWNQLTQDERQQLVKQPCESAAEIQSFREALHRMVEGHGSDRPSDLPIEATPPWQSTTIPDSILEQAEKMGVTVTPQQWENLTPLKRFALIKLSRSNHENRNFVPALEEFSIK